METASTTPSPDFQVAVIGAGFAGIGSAIQLDKHGLHDYVVFERADEVGGTWRDNTYPGAACDVPSHAYSFSFELNPSWTHHYSGSAEIQAYLLHCVEKYGIRPKIRFGTEIVEARFDEDAGVWSLTTDSGDVVTARAVLSGVGGLVDPAWPDIKGLEEFGGEIFHTARWNHDYDLAGREVAVIGTGASAVQVVPSIAPEVARLTVFQRTPAWVMPKGDVRFSERFKDRFRRHPRLMRLFRDFIYGMSELFGGPAIILNAPRFKRIFERQSLAHLAKSVPDPAVREKLTPHFQFGCKRILISDDYWASFARENVELVTEPIEAVHEKGLRTRDGRDHPADAIVLATGFDVGLVSAPFPIFGRGGRSLDDAWAGGARAYKGMTVSGFPNWFILMGPNTGPGHTSVLVYTETQIRYAIQAILRMETEGIQWFDVKQDVQDAYNEGIQRRMPYTSWSSGCNSWYLSEGGANNALFPGLASEYVLRARRFRPSEYESAR
jgi:cation diffusion facilitator CzcD-associated flavoprotein CzcO